MTPSQTPPLFSSPLWLPYHNCLPGAAPSGGGGWGLTPVWLEPADQAPATELGFSPDWQTPSCLPPSNADLPPYHPEPSPSQAVMPGTKSAGGPQGAVDLKLDLRSPPESAKKPQSKDSSVWNGSPSELPNLQKTKGIT